MKYYITEKPLDLIGSNKAPKNAIQEAPKDENGQYIKYMSDIKLNNGNYVFDPMAREVRLAKKEARRQMIEYKQKRRAEYPLIADQLDALYKKFHLNDNSAYDEIASQIEAIKQKYPKTN